MHRRRFHSSRKIYLHSWQRYLNFSINQFLTIFISRTGELKCWPRQQSRTCHKWKCEPRNLTEIWTMRKTSTSSSTQPVQTFQHRLREIASGEDWTDFEYWLRISNDFYTPLLSRGPNIKVPCLPWPSLLVRKVYKSLCRLVSSMKSIGQHAFGTSNILFMLFFERDTLPWL